MRLWVVLLLSLLAGSARASGPVERLLQLLVHPSQPDLLVVRYGAGAGSHGFLFSRDGGRSFQLVCSASVSAAKTLAVQRVSTRAIPSTAATIVDQHGAVMFAQYGASWIDDGTGCAWSDVPELRDKWPLALAHDPRDVTALLGVVSTSGKVELMRRVEARGSSAREQNTEHWASAGTIREVDADKVVIDASMAVHAQRLYASLLMQGAKGLTAGYVMRSNDGKRWTAQLLPKDQERLNVLAVDPTNADRVLAAISRDGAADSLLLSTDGGKTFRTYLEPRAVGGVTFDEAGRVFVGDIGDGAALQVDGGLYTAAQLGTPLAKVSNTAGIDCVVWHRDRLYVCNGDRFGVMDPETGRLEELLRIDQVRDFVSCPGQDLHAVCRNQLNSGPSWCCAGHYPFTPLCADYDVTERPDHGRVVCGRSAREYERPSPPVAAPQAAPPASEERRWPHVYLRAGLTLLGIVVVFGLLRLRRRRRGATPE